MDPRARPTRPNRSLALLENIKPGDHVTIFRYHWEDLPLNPETGRLDLTELTRDSAPVLISDIVSPRIRQITPGTPLLVGAVDSPFVITRGYQLRPSPTTGHPERVLVGPWILDCRRLTLRLLPEAFVADYLKTLSPPPSPMQAFTPPPLDDFHFHQE